MTKRDLLWCGHFAVGLAILNWLGWRAWLASVAMSGFALAAAHAGFQIVIEDYCKRVRDRVGVP